MSCLACALWAGAPSVLPPVTEFPVFAGAIAVGGSAVVVLRVQGVTRREFPEWFWESVPKSLLLLSALAGIFSWLVFEHMPHFPRGSPEAMAGQGQDAEALIGFPAIFYVYGGSILVGALRAFKEE